MSMAVLTEAQIPTLEWNWADAKAAGTPHNSVNVGARGA